MVLNFEYGINTGNRFLDFVDHDEDPDEFIARQTQPEEKSKKSTKDSKTTSSATSKKSTTKATPTSTTNVTSTTTKANKENVTGKSTNDQRRPQSSISGDNNQQQQQRTDSGRGGGRGFSRRGASSAGQERPAYEGGGRGGGQQRSQRFNRYDGQPGSREPRNFEQSGEVGEGESHPQRFGGYQGRGRGGGGDRGRGAPRGTFYNRNYEGGRGRGRGRGGRGSFNNRNIEEGSQPQHDQQQPQQQQLRTQEDNEWHSNTDSSFDNTRSQPVKTENEDSNVDSSLQERSFEPDGTRRGGRGHFRARTFRSNRSYGQEHQYQHDRESGEGGQAEYRHNRRQHDRQPRSYTSTVKPAEKKDGEGAHNWGNATEIPDEQLPTDELDETTEQGASTGKGWAEQVDEAEKKQMTLDEYKKQLEEKKRVNQEKVPQLNRRVAGEGEDQRNWQFKHEYRKKNDDGESGEEEEEEQASDVEEDEDDDSEQVSGKKKLITIPLRFNPVELPRGSPFGSRGGQRRGGGGRFQDRPYRDDQQRSKSPNQQQSPVSPQTGEYHRGGPRQGSGRGEYRRSYGNSARGSRGGYNRSNPNPNTLDLNDTRDFPTLLKQ